MTLPRVSTFGTIPHLLQVHQSCDVSWWLEPMSRDEFMRRAEIEALRMQGSKGAGWVESLRIVSLSEWI